MSLLAMKPCSPIILQLHCPALYEGCEAVLHHQILTWLKIALMLSYHAPHIMVQESAGAIL
jgi:hypothetical protein